MTDIAELMSNSTGKSGGRGKGDFGLGNDGVSKCDDDKAGDGGDVHVYVLVAGLVGTGRYGVQVCLGVVRGVGLRPSSLSSNLPFLSIEIIQKVASEEFRF